MQAELFNVFFGLLLALFLPGFPLTLALYPRKGLEQTERLMHSILLSISTTVVGAYALSKVMGLAINGDTFLSITAAVSVLSVSVYLIRLRGLPSIYIETHEYTAARILKIISLILLISLCAILSYIPHIGYDYPLSINEWNEIALAGNPSSGYGILLAELCIYTGQDIVVFQRFLPAIFSAIAALTLFVFTYRLTGSRNAGLLSILFLSASQIGGWYFSSMTLGYIFIYAALYTSVSGMHAGEKTKLIPSALFFSALALIHPTSLLIALSVTIIYILARPIFIKKNPLWAVSLLMMLILMSGVLLVGLRELYAVEPAAKSALSSGSLLTAFCAALSAYLIIKEKRFSAEVLCIWLFLMIALILAGRLIGLEIQAKYILLPLLPLAGTGLYSMLVRLNKGIKNSYISLVISILFIASITGVLFAGYGSDERLMSKQLDDETYEALKMLSYRHDGNASVFIRPHIAYVVYPITGKQPAVVPSEGSYRFFSSQDCIEKESMMRQSDVTYIVVGEEDYLDCDGFREIYYHEGVYIYQVD